MNASMPTEQEFNMVAAAIKGEVESADAIIDMFVKSMVGNVCSNPRNDFCGNVSRRTDRRHD